MLIQLVVKYFQTSNIDFKDVLSDIFILIFENFELYIFSNSVLVSNLLSNLFYMHYMIYTSLKFTPGF